jgi:hypothetical protein
MNAGWTTHHAHLCDSRCPCKTQPGDYRPAAPTVMVYDIELDLNREVSESEARAGMLRYAQTLGAGTAARASVEDMALNGELDAFPPLRPAWRRS